jgi:hypothetical protein
MLLEVAPAQEKPTSPFKLNPNWLKEEKFVNKIKEVWEPYDGSLREFAPIQFQQNLKREKKVASPMANEKNKRMKEFSRKWRKL